jgi:hypothetical protein
MHSMLRCLPAAGATPRSRVASSTRTTWASAAAVRFCAKYAGRRPQRSAKQLKSRSCTLAASAKTRGLVALIGRRTSTNGPQLAHGSSARSAIPRRRSSVSGCTLATTAKSRGLVAIIGKRTSTIGTRWGLCAQAATPRHQSSVSDSAGVRREAAAQGPASDWKSVDSRCSASSTHHSTGSV